MNDSMAQPRTRLARLDLPGWKVALNWTAAVVLGAYFLVSGVWKIVDVPAWAMRLEAFKVPEGLATAGAFVLGVAETLTSLFLFVPRLRRWGAMMAGVLLVIFMLYFGIRYSDFRGADCSCSPWLKTEVGPVFFLRDAAMLALAAIAAWWTRRSQGLRNAVLILGAVCVFAGVSYGVEVVRHAGAQAPASITVEGKPYDLSTGKVLVFFFNPACTHCSDTAKAMSKLDWGDTRIVAAPVDLPQFGAQFLAQTGLRAVLTSDFEKLKDPLQYRAYPYAVALVDGHVKASMTKLGGDEPAATLRRLGFAR